MEFHVFAAVGGILLYSLPRVIALSVVLMLLLRLPHGVAGRATALSGAAIVLATAIFSIFFSMLPSLYQVPDATVGLYSVISIVGFILNIGSAIGLVVMVWGLCQAVGARSSSR